jgi:hypothetical protein
MFLSETNKMHATGRFSKLFQEKHRKQIAKIRYGYKTAVKTLKMVKRSDTWECWGSGVC